MAGFFARSITAYCSISQSCASPKNLMQAIQKDEVVGEAVSKSAVSIGKVENQYGINMAIAQPQYQYLARSN